MTHMNHRRGTRESLEGDYVVLVMTQKGINDEGARSGLQKVFDSARAHNAVNLGDGKRNTVFVLGWENMYNGMIDHGVSQAVFTNPRDLAGFLAAMREADLGISTVVSGLFDVTTKCCQEAGIKPHTVEYSGGVRGKTDQMPEPKQQEFMTMCGHGMVPGHLVDHLVVEVKKGGMTADDAAMRMTKLCICGVFNPARASKLISEMATQ